MTTQLNAQRQPSPKRSPKRSFHRRAFERRSFKRRNLLLALGVVMPLVAGLFVSSIGAVAKEEKKEKKAKPGMVEVRQGGYVEQVDPNVDYKDRLPRILPREPAESMKAFHIVPGFRLEAVATEPLIADPVDMVFDADGRLFVAQLITYSELEQTGKPPVNTSRISLLEDLDGDGRFDKSTLFADGLSWPTGLVPFDGGLFVATTPEILYLKDTNGDKKADLREVYLSGFTESNPNACPNSLRFGLDNRIHGMTSTSGGKLKAVKWERGAEGRKVEAVESRGRDFSFHPKTGQMRLESGGSQFGLTFDAWGRKFESSNSVPIEMVMYEDRYIARNPYLAAPASRRRIHVDGNTVYRTSPAEPWRILRTELRVAGTFSGPIEGGGTPAGYFTGACGVYVYKGNLLPKPFRGNAVVGEGSGNLVHRMRLDPDGVAMTAHRTEKKHEFLTSDEIWFRPVQFVDGPDGALYMADFYREIYEHPNAVPPSARKHLDLLAGNDRGRVYRIVPEQFKQPAPVRLRAKASTDLVGLLAHPNWWHRNTAARLLFERQDRKAIEPLKKLAAESASPLGRMHALYVLAGHDALAPEVVLARLADPHPRVREHAVRLAERVLADSPAVREKLYAMTSDDDLGVRWQLAFTLGEITGTKASAALASITQSDVGDRWVRLAVLSSSFGRAGELFGILARESKWRATKNGRTFLEELAEQVGLQNRNDQVAEVLKTLEAFGKKEKKLAQGVVRGLSRGLDKSNSPLLASIGSGSGSRAGQLLGEMVAQAKEAAADEAQPIEKRLAAIRSLGLTSFDDVADILADLLDSRQPQAVQTAAIQALNRFTEDDVAEIIVDGWLGFTPKVRGEAAEALFARPSRIGPLLAAIDDQIIRPSQLDPARIQFLLAHPDASIRAKSSELLSGATLAPREQIVAAWRDVLETRGDPARGKAVFKRECSKCHLLEGVGVELGLPLNTIGNRGAETILLAVLDPNREVNPAYLNYVVVTDEGLSLTGMITSETATSITLKRAEGETDTVLRTNIDELVNTGLSIMPEGQEKLLTKKEMSDVIEYLMSLE